MNAAQWDTTADVYAMLKHAAGSMTPRRCRLYVVALLRTRPAAVKGAGLSRAVGLSERVAERLATDAQRAKGAARVTGSCDIAQAVKIALAPDAVLPGLVATAVELVDSPRAADLLRCIVPFGEPPSLPAVSPEIEAAVIELYYRRQWHLLPALGVRLRAAGFDAPTILNHCAAGTRHARGCWACHALTRSSP